MAFTEDFTEFFDITGGFAVNATYNGTTTIAGIFDNGYAESLGGDVASTDPMFLCPVGALTEAGSIGKTLLIGSTTYVIVGFEPDGTGMVNLQLRV